MGNAALGQNYRYCRNTASVWTEVSVNGIIGFKNVAYGGLI